MSECVVRMEMPKGCVSCPIANFGYCSINHKQVCDPLIGYPENRPANCPIICQLPEGHGRLVDADKLADDMKARKAFFGRMSDPQCLVEDAHTIVPPEAERSET